MKKNMYSIMLAEQVVEEIDNLAKRQNTNRSNLINQVLAEYVSLVTPEKRIFGIFHSIEELLGGDFSLYYSPNDYTMSIKSPLQYRYRPTIRYEVEIYRSPKFAIGELKVNFRTQSPELILELTRFFKLWIRLEDIYISKFYPDNSITYSLSETRFTRSLAVPDSGEYSSEELSAAIVDYVRCFDELMKLWLGGELSNETELEGEYLKRMSGARII